MVVFMLFLIPIVIVFLAISVSRQSNRRYIDGNNHPYIGDYSSSSSNNCDSFGGDGGGCGGGGE